MLLTTSICDATVLDGIRAGATGVLLKKMAHTELAEAVRTVARGEPVVHQAVLPILFTAVRTTPPAPVPLAAPTLLTARERTVLHLVAAGLANASIAERLNITVATVKRHLSTVFMKLEVRNRAEAVTTAHAQHEL